LDNLTHILTGVALARTGLDKRIPGATLTLVLASNLPDVDLISGFWGTVPYLEYHRGLSHAFAASPFLAGALALVLSFWPKSVRRFVPTFALAWLGVCLHIVWDLWTSYGTRALLPFDATWYAWDWMFIIDPVFLLLLVVASFGARWSGRPIIGRVALGLALAFIGLRAGAHSLALGQAQSLAGSEFSLVRVLPEPLSPNKWRFIAAGETAFATGYVQAIGTERGKVEFPRTAPNAVVRSVARDSKAARVFLDFSAMHRIEVRYEGEDTLILWRDLRFADRRAEGFFCEVRLDGKGRIVSERVVF
jgi:inner membrane protein